MHTGCMKASRILPAWKRVEHLAMQQHTLHSCLFLKAEFSFTLPGLCDELLMHYSQNPCRCWFYRVGDAHQKPDFLCGMFVGEECVARVTWQPLSR